MAVERWEIVTEEQERSHDIFHCVIQVASVNLRFTYLIEKSVNKRE